MPSLLDVPNELLDIVKDEVLRHEYPIRLTTDPGLNDNVSFLKLGLLSTNRRLFVDCVPLFYALNTVTLTYAQLRVFVDGHAPSSVWPALPSRLLILPSPTSPPCCRKGGRGLVSAHAGPPEPKDISGRRRCRDREVFVHVLRWLTAVPSRRLESLGRRAFAGSYYALCAPGEAGRDPALIRLDLQGHTLTSLTWGIGQEARRLLPRACRTYVVEAWLIGHFEYDPGSGPLGGNQRCFHMGPTLAWDERWDHHPQLSVRTLEHLRETFHGVQWAECWSGSAEAHGAQGSLVRWMLTFGEV